MGRLLKLWGPVAAWMAVILLAGAWSEKIPRGVAAWDKAVHGTFYGVLALLAARASHGGWGGLVTPGAWRMLAALVVTLACGGFDEWTQRLVPRRVPDFDDWLADAAGGAAVLLALWVWAAIRRAWGPRSTR